MARYTFAIALLVAAAFVAAQAKTDLKLISPAPSMISILFSNDVQIAGYQFTFVEFPKDTTIIALPGTDSKDLPVTYSDVTRTGLAFSMSGKTVFPRNADGELISFKVTKPGFYCVDKIILSDPQARTIEYALDENCVKVEV